MRILQVHNAYRDPGGEDVSVAAEAALLRGGGHEVRRLVARNPKGRRATIKALALAPHNRFAARGVIEAAREFEPDVAHVNNTWFSLSPAVLGALVDEGIPTVVTLRNYRTACMQGLLFRDGGVCTDCVGRSPLPGVRHRCYRGSAALSAVAATTISLNRHRGTWLRPQRLIAPSESARSILVGAGLSTERIDVVPNAIPDPGPRTGAPSASRKLLFVGRLTPEKGVRTLLEAWHQRSRKNRLELVLIGDGPLRAALERELPDGARITGWREPQAVREAMLGARALIFPTQVLEPFGRGAAEALAAGLPVLGSDLGATAEILGELGAEWRVRADDVRGWAAAIESLDDDDRVDKAGARARDAYKRTYSPSRTLSGLERAYASAIHASPRIGRG